MTSMQRQTTSSAPVGAGGSGCSSAAAPTARTGTVGPAMRASTSRGARPSPTIAVSAGRRPLQARRRIRGHDRDHPPGVVALEPDERALAPPGRDADRWRPTATAVRQVDARRHAGARAARAVTSAGQIVARTDRLDLGRAGGDHDLVRRRRGASRPASGRRPSGRGRRPRPRCPSLGIEDAGRPACRLRVRRGPLAGLAATDDHDLRLAALDDDLGRERRPRDVGAATSGSGGMPRIGWRDDGQPWSGRRPGTSGRRRRRRRSRGSCRSRRPGTASRRGPAPRRRGGWRSPPSRRPRTAIGRPSTTIRPPTIRSGAAMPSLADDRSVTGASAGPAGRRAARAGVGPVVAGR